MEPKDQEGSRIIFFARFFCINPPSIPYTWILTIPEFCISLRINLYLHLLRASFDSLTAMAKDGPNWDGLLKWSLAHSDGTRPNRNLRFSLSLSA